MSGIQKLSSILGIIKPSQVLVAGPHIENLEKWREIGASTTEENGEVTRTLSLGGQAFI